MTGMPDRYSIWRRERGAESPPPIHFTADRAGGASLVPVLLGLDQRRLHSEENSRLHPTHRHTSTHLPRPGDVRLAPQRALLRQQPVLQVSDHEHITGLGQTATLHSFVMSF